MREFIPGLKLSELFYHEAVQPILADEFPNLVYSAARIGAGSEVLGFDTPLSTDHDWGPRLMLFLTAADHDQYANAITLLLRERLPHTLHDWPVSFTEPDPQDNNTQTLAFAAKGPVNHRVEVLTLRNYGRDYLGFDSHESLTPADWLTFPTPKLRALTAGAVYRDEVGLADLRQRLAWYPHDVWLFLLAAGWRRISQDEHLMGRAGSVGDELGAALIGSRLVRDVMNLAFLMARQYAPYAKWFGTAFQRLDCAPFLAPHLQAALAALRWQERESHLGAAYEALARMHNALALTEPLPVQVTSFFERPFQVIWGGRFADALMAQVSDPAVAALPVFGSIDQFSDNTDLLSDAAWRLRVKALYTGDQAES